MKNLFIVSVQRSGSNWLQRCLDFHPKIMVRGEVHPSRFLALMEQMHTGDEVSEAVMQAKKIYSEIARYGVQRMVEANLESNGYDCTEFEGYMADKTAFVCHNSLKSNPEQFQYIQLLQRHFPGAKKILLVRDIRDIIVSVASWKGKAEKLRLLSLSPKGYVLFIRYIRNWVTLHEQWVSEVKNDPNGLVVSFKGMKMDFRQVMTQVHEFLELPVDMKYIEELYSKFYSITSKVYEEENRRRGYSFFRSGRIGEWRNCYQWYHFPVLWFYNQKINEILKQV